MKLLPLTQGKFAMVSDADFEELNKYKWRANKQGRGFYAIRGIWKFKQTVYMHRVIMGALPGQQVDHIDGNPLNNQRANLRIVDYAGQRRGFQSKRRGKSSEFRGVYWNKPLQKWQAQIQHAGCIYYVGIFENEREAAHARDAKAREFGWPESGMNFPKEQP